MDRGDQRILDMADQDGLTPIMAAAAKDHLNIVRLLFDKGANIELVDRRDWYEVARVFPTRCLSVEVEATHLLKHQLLQN